jgi:NADP-dependent alcohol dehydrogenase
VWTWHVPTVVVAGDGALSEWGPLVRSYGRRALVVTDPAVRSGSDVVGNCVRTLAAAGVAADVDTVPTGPPTLEGARRLLDRQRAAGAACIVAIGGGTVLDPAKVAAAATRHPELLDERVWAGGGLIEPNLPLVRRALPMIAVPTTVGTGSEVSPSASIAVGGAKKLLVHAAIRPSVAVLDPAATATTPRPVIVEGAFEILLRTIGQRVVEAGSLPVQDAMVAGLAPSVLADGDLVAGRDGAVLDDEIAARHRLALASAATHASWVLCGRDRFAHRLWYLANEWAPTLGVSKVAATAALALPYLSALEGGSLAGPTGATNATTVATALFGRGARLSEGIAGVIDRWRLPRSLSGLGADSAIADDVCRRTWAAWGPPSPALAGLQPIDIAALYQAALEPAVQGP